MENEVFQIWAVNQILLLCIIMGLSGLSKLDVVCVLLNYIIATKW